MSEESGFYLWLIALVLDSSMRETEEKENERMREREKGTVK